VEMIFFYRPSLIDCVDSPCDVIRDLSFFPLLSGESCSTDGLVKN
jgi:hypothetical protein